MMLMMMRMLVKLVVFWLSAEVEEVINVSSEKRRSLGCQIVESMMPIWLFWLLLLLMLSLLLLLLLLRLVVC
jgi:hypothetical protein